MAQPLPQSKTKARITAISPHFVVPDVVAAARHYRDALGFEILGYFGEPPTFATVRRDAAEIQFSKADAGAEPTPNAKRQALALDAYIWIDDADALSSELKARGAKILEGPVRRVYNVVEIVVEDCCGYRLVFAADCTPRQGGPKP